MILLLPMVLMGSASTAHRLVVAAALVAPLPTLLGLGLVLARTRRSGEAPVMGDEAAALLDVLGSLRAGETLRSSLAGLSSEVGRMVRVGASTDVLAGAVGRSLGDQGPIAAAAVRLLDEAGGPAAPVIEELAAQATETVRIKRELRAAVAAPVLQGAIVGGAPLAVLVSLVVSGGFGRIVTTSSAHAMVAFGGTAMTLVGVGWVIAIVRKAMP
jgi:Flp pilus assembly protein TadB